MQAPPYTASTGNTYFLNTTLTAFFDAERACTNNGGHLASYLTPAEQFEVEQVGAAAYFKHRCGQGNGVDCSAPGSAC